jgi:hypothetical protein
MSPSSDTGQVLVHTPAPGNLVMGPTSAALSRALVNAPVSLLGHERALTAYHWPQISAEYGCISRARPAMLSQSRASLSFSDPVWIDMLH